MQMISIGFKSFNDISFLMMTKLSITLVFITTVFAFSGVALNDNFAMGQTNTTGTEGSDGNTAKMHVDEALKALQSNDNNGATMHIQEAQKNL